MGAKEILKGKQLGFSLLELMVVIAILGVLATVAVPRFNIFRARARQGEAKINLGAIFTLQESFAIEHERYYDGVTASWGGQAMNSAAVRVGYFVGNVHRCTPAQMRNKLGFRLANCTETRYGYYIAGANETQFLSVAFGASDQVGSQRVFPGCNGGTQNIDVSTATGGTNVQDRCDATHPALWRTTNSAFAAGDAWCMDQARRLDNYRDIVEFCE